MKYTIPSNQHLGDDSILRLDPNEVYYQVFTANRNVDVEVLAICSLKELNPTDISIIVYETETGVRVNKLTEGNEYAVGVHIGEKAELRGLKTYESSREFLIKESNIFAPYVYTSEHSELPETLPELTPRYNRNAGYALTFVFFKVS